MLLLKTQDFFVYLFYFFLQLVHLTSDGRQLLLYSILKLTGYHVEVLLLDGLQFANLSVNFLTFKFSLQFLYLFFILFNNVTQECVLCHQIYAVAFALLQVLDQRLNFFQLLLVQFFVPPQIVFFEEQQIHSIQRVQIFILYFIQFLSSCHTISFNLQYLYQEYCLMLKIVLALVKNKPILVPTYKLNSVDEMLKVPRLTNEDKKVFIFDKDDTLVSLHQFKVTNGSICNLLSHLKQGGKKVYVVSNSVTNHGHQVTYLDENNVQQTIDILHTKQKKPYNAEQIQQLIESYPENKAQNIKLNWSNTVVVGDRLLTDIVLGNLLGWTTVLVRPIEETKIGKHGLGVFVIRKIQNLIINIL